MNGNLFGSSYLIGEFVIGQVDICLITVKAKPTGAEI